MEKTGSKFKEVKSHDNGKLKNKNNEVIHNQHLKINLYLFSDIYSFKKFRSSFFDHIFFKDDNFFYISAF